MTKTIAMRIAPFAAFAMALGAASPGFAGSSAGYSDMSLDGGYGAGSGGPVAVTTAASAPVYQPYPSGAVTPDPYMQAMPAAPKTGYYDAGKYGGNDQFGYAPSSACGGLLEGEKCLVILTNHMRRMRLDRDAATILVGNPRIADVTVLGKDTLFVTARTIGSTNIIALDENGDEIGSYEVFVREPDAKRVTLRQGSRRSNFQCAPYCERALSMTDTPEAHSAQAGVINTEMGLDSSAIGLQSGGNPNTDIEAASAAQQAAGLELAEEGVSSAGGAASMFQETMGAAGEALGAAMQGAN